MKILLTGASGFLGSNLRRHIPSVIPVYNSNKIENGYWCDLTSQSAVKYLLKMTEPEVIIHVAANPIPKHPENYLEFANNHIHSLLNLLEHCKEGTKFIFISSINVYGSTFPVPYPTNLYGALKLSCEEIIKSYQTLKNIVGLSVRPCAMVGPGLTHGLLYDIQRKLKLDTEYLELFGNCPGTCKPFVHVDDVCRLVKDLLHNNEYSIIDCFPQDSLTVEEVANITMNKLNIHKPIKWLGDSTIWKGDNKVIDTSKFLTFNAPLKYKTSKEAIENAIQT